MHPRKAGPPQTIHPDLFWFFSLFLTLIEVFTKVSRFALNFDPPALSPEHCYWGSMPPNLRFCFFLLPGICLGLADF